jgi:uncharacterized repeat protein (TIGR01451 family)
MKNYSKLLAVGATFAFAVGMTQSVKALGVTAGTFVTNIATVAGSNFTTSSSAPGPATITVATALGAKAAGTADATLAAGRYVTNYLSVTNYGNGTTGFVFSYVTGSTTGTPNSPMWTNGFGATFTTTTTVAGLAPGASGTALYRVYVPASAGNNSVRSWALRASNNYAGATAVGTNYVGDNAVAYGGDQAKNGAGLRRVVVGAGAQALSNKAGFGSNFTWTVQVQAAVVTVQKSVTLISNVLGTARALPGSTVTYKITLSNNGAAQAKGVEVRDTVPNNTAYKANGLRFADNIGSTYGAAAALADTAGGDRGEWNGTTRVEFVGAGGTADNTTGNSAGTLNNGTGQSYFFRVTVN